MIEIDGRLFIGIGNQPAGTDGGLIANLAADGTLQSEYIVDEQGVHDMHLHAGKLYIPGTDPSDDWSFGNLYIRGSDGVWIKRRTLPNVLHTWGLCNDADDNLWVSVGAHAGDNQTWEGRVMRSQDDGLTWDKNVLVNNYRVYDIAIRDNVFYAIGYLSNAVQLLYMSPDGENWSAVSGVTPYRLQRLIAHDGQLICARSDLSGLVVIGATISDPVLPFSFPAIALNCISSDGVYLYCVDEYGNIWRSADIDAWQKYSRVSGAISIGYWATQNCLVVSDMGTNAKIWKVNLS